MILEVGQFSFTPLAKRVRMQTNRVGEVVVEVTATARLGSAGDEAIEDRGFPLQRNTQTVRPAVQSPGQAAVDVEKGAGDGAIGELELLSRQPASHRERHLVFPGPEANRSSFQAELIVAEIVAEIVIQQSQVVATAAATIQLHKVGEVRIERVPRDDDPRTFELKLIQILIGRRNVGNRVPEVGPNH